MDKDVKRSRWNFEYLRAPGEHIIYNTYSKAVVSLDDGEYKQFETLEFTGAELSEALKEEGFLVDSSFDEVAFMRYCHYRTKYGNDTLHLIIAPTLDCNFGCPYCYENRRSGVMDEATQDAIVEYIREAANKGTKQFEVTWYGGEPLLYMDVVKSLGNRINDFIREEGLVVNMYMVSNGYLLDEKTVGELEELGVMRIQITIDGLAVHHDKRRHLRGGQPTFDRIMKNLKLFDDSPIRVDIRMNVDNENAGDYMELNEMIRALDNPNVVLYPSPVEDINKDTVNTLSEFMTKSEFEDFASRMRKKDDSLFETAVMDDRYCFCNAETESCYVVDELGNFYKCWDQGGRLEYSCFNINKKDEINYKNICSFLSWEPFEDPKCGKCVFLPLCFGGCKFKRMTRDNDDCGFNDRTVTEYVESLIAD